MKEAMSVAPASRRLPLTALLGIFGGAALGYYAYRKYKPSGRQEQEHPHEEHEVDTSSEDSFPASDPPSWNSGHATRWED
ncbi:hypothetical protein AB1A81_08705 [Bdellovibrio bacteriovorus]|uniref:Uncharacterized protein n=1 Tax=Bdellovibrio bacteriovorus (strain ATCC 15356 / DSM 50701 / NCIMB 9529 / HD100) TaxID=264462 RepID=Q6MLU6_BDEBA|nr:hypothetical protein [Bdellovibrio bacteriovorus]CAE79760.1 hypothetical protein predicted by Glimmer/Critica [Bdellovibrio bacteriovorus HD100]